LALASVIFVSCMTIPDADVPPGELTITGIPAEFEGMYVVFSRPVAFSPISGRYDIIASAERPDRGSITGTAITNGRVDLPLYIDFHLSNAPSMIRGYTRSDTCDIEIFISSTKASGNPVAGGSVKSVQFKNGVARVRWDDAVSVRGSATAARAPAAATGKSSAIPLTIDTWADGYIAPSDSEQWFKFTATATPQYLYVKFSTMTDLYVQVYDSSEHPVGNQTTLRGNTGSTASTSQALTSGATYYIKVTPYYSSGTYRLGFTDFPKEPEATVTQLTIDTWADGYIAPSGYEQWFKFTATASPQYLHVKFSTMTDLYVQLNDSSAYTVGSPTLLRGNTVGTKSTSQALTSGATYYIKVTPYYSGGTYRIGFNTSTTAPD
jgi:hypothetical protein